MASETLFTSGTHGDVADLLNKTLRKLPEWAGDHTFADGEATLHEGVLYVSLQDANLNRNPGTEGAWWVRYMPADAVPCVTDTVDPTAGENTAAGFANCTIWLNTTTDTGWLKTGETGGVAVWTEVGPGAAAGVQQMWVDPDDGTGLTGNVGIQDLPSSVNIFDSDLIAVLDVSLGYHVGSTKAKLLHDVPRNTRAINAGDGLTGSGTLADDISLALDIGSLSAVTPTDADSVAIHDDSGAGPARVLVSALKAHIASSIAGSAISYSANVSEDIEATNVQDAIDEVAAERLRADFAALTAATVAAGDDLVALRTSGGESRRITVADLLAGVDGGGGVESVFGVAETAVDMGDFASLVTRRDTAALLVYDDSEAINARNRSMTIATLLDGLVDDARSVGTAAGSGLDGGGALDANLALELEFNGLDVAPQVQATDAIATYRSANDTHYVATVTQLAAIVENLVDPDMIPYDNAGTALIADNVGDALDELDAEVLRGDLTLLTELATADADDLVPIWDTNAAVIKYIQKSNLVSEGGGTVDAVFGVSEATIEFADFPSEATPAGTDEVLVDRAGTTSRATITALHSGLVPDSRQVIAGTGLSGGGNLSGNRTFDLDITGLPDLGEEPADTDELLISDGGVMKRVAYSEIKSIRVTMSADAPDVGTHNDTTGYPVGSLWYQSGTRFTWMYANDGLGDERWRGIATPRVRFDAPSNPGVNDDSTLRYQFGSVWMTTSGALWYCKSNTAGAAEWVLANPVNEIDSATAPGVNDDSADNFTVGSHFVHDVNGDGSQRDMYSCADPAAGAAVWHWIGGDRTEVHAYRAIPQAVLIAGTVTVLYSTQVTDANAEYEPTTGVFTANAAGLYQVNFSLQSAAATVGTILASTFGQLEFLPTASDTIQGSAIMRLAAAETVRVQATFTGEGSIVGDEDRTWLQITRIG